MSAEGEGALSGAAQGAAAGSVAGPWGAVIGGAVGAIGGAMGGKGADRAASAAAKAAGNQVIHARNAYKKLAGAVEPLTTAGLLNYDKSIAAQERNLARQEQLVAQIDPAIIEASQQALKLLKGERSSTLGPMEQQRAQQRQTLLNTLREQLGPGAEMSTAGMQALTRFDSETNQLTSNQQQQAISNLGGLTAQLSSTRPDLLREATGLGAIGQGRAGLGMQAAELIWNARQPFINAVGGQQIGGMMRGQYQQAQGNALMNSASQFAGMYAGGGFGGGGGASSTPSSAMSSSQNDYSIFGSQNQGRYDLL